MQLCQPHKPLEQSLNEYIDAFWLRIYKYKVLFDLHVKIYIRLNFNDPSYKTFCY